jgi:hypothetical protein
LVRISSVSSTVTSQALIDLFRPRLIVYSKVFQVLFVHLVYNSALFLPSCCCLFLLHVVENLICIVLVSGQLVLLSTFQNVFISTGSTFNVPKCLHFNWFYFQRSKMSSFLLWSKLCIVLFWKVSSQCQFLFS